LAGDPHPHHYQRLFPASASRTAIGAGGRRQRRYSAVSALRWGGYAERLRPIFDLLAGWQRDHGTVVHTWQSHEGWTRRYLGFGDEMLPFEDGRPRQSREVCPAKHCKQLHDGKIWKCAPLAYLGLQKAKFDLSGKWDPYLQYSPLDVTCTDRELDEFLTVEDEPACSMCSAERRPYQLPNPLRNEARASAPAISPAA
jgi:hypothetical protein